MSSKPSVLVSVGLTPGPKLSRSRRAGWLYSHHRGFNLAFFLVMATALIGFAGVAIYTGLQGYLQGELQKAASTAVLAGSAAFYEGKAPTPKPNNAKDIATDTFEGIVANSDALQGFDAKIVASSISEGNDAITLSVTGSMPTPLLSLIGVNQVQVKADATGRALTYVPTAPEYGGTPITMFPPDETTFDLPLDFPVVDLPNSDDMLILQVDRAGYSVEACSGNTCYDVTNGATPYGDAKIVTRNGRKFIYGSAYIDLAAAGVAKADKLRFKDDMVFNRLNADDTVAIDWVPMPTIINHVEIYGYSSSCVAGNLCSVPFGFRPMP